MKIIFQQYSLNMKTLLVTLWTAILLQACAQSSSQEKQPIKIDGSSTVAPITQVVLDKFKGESENKDVKVEANISGTR